MGKLVRIFGVLVIVFMVYGYAHSDDATFKLKCAAYQAHLPVELSFPDKAVCVTFYRLKN